MSTLRVIVIHTVYTDILGLGSAPATFSHLMRKLLKGMDNLDNFLDDILVFTETLKVI